MSRGNLGLDVLPEKMALAQKAVISNCNLLGKPVLITRVVDTMVNAPRPTRYGLGFRCNPKPPQACSPLSGCTAAYILAVCRSHQQGKHAAPHMAAQLLTVWQRAEAISRSRAHQGAYEQRPQKQEGEALLDGWRLASTRASHGVVVTRTRPWLMRHAHAGRRPRMWPMLCWMAWTV